MEYRKEDRPLAVTELHNRLHYPTFIKLVKITIPFENKSFMHFRGLVIHMQRGRFKQQAPNIVFIQFNWTQIKSIFDVHFSKKTCFSAKC